MPEMKASMASFFVGGGCHLDFVLKGERVYKFATLLLFPVVDLVVGFSCGLPVSEGFSGNKGQAFFNTEISGTVSTCPLLFTV